MNPFLSIEGIVGILFFAFCAAFVFFRTQRPREFQPVDFTIMSMGIVYGSLLPVVVHGAVPVDYIGARFIIASGDIILLHTAAAFLAVIGVYLGWRTLPQKTNERLGLFFSRARLGKIVFWLYVMTATALVTQYLYTIDYGGFLGYFDYNRLVRSGLFNAFERSRFSFLSPFGGMAVFACYGFWGLLLSKKRGY